MYGTQARVFIAIACCLGLAGAKDLKTGSNWSPNSIYLSNRKGSEDRQQKRVEGGWKEVAECKFDAKFDNWGGLEEAEEVCLLFSFSLTKMFSKNVETHPSSQCYSHAAWVSSIGIENALRILWRTTFCRPNWRRRRRNPEPLCWVIAMHQTLRSSQARSFRFHSSSRLTFWVCSWI